ncbi:GNAT family N-acetyltransferase [Ferrimonas balearica]|uniref:GNAT family N-acetyltransferase n=1 Tax=Ferrimonas balearica TaxID=44012 RepID=UPI0021BDBAD5|nr:GNAT family N-acetyltransferase [Ferrimonas balearica]
MTPRPIASQDRELIRGLYGDSERMARIGPALTDSQIERLMTERLKPWSPEADHWGCWVMEDQQGALGIVGLRRLPMEQATAEVGFMMLQRGEGRGLASRGLSWLCQQAERQWGFERLVALCLPDNQRSITLLERHRFRYGYRLPQAVPWNEAFRDAVVYLRDRDTEAAEG